MNSIYPNNDSATKKVRASGPRSRGGCNTCKIRRVKCDEEKPGCVRCKKFGRVCDGYEINRPPDPPRKARMESTSIRTRHLLPISLAPNRWQVPITLSFQDELEERYFRLFHDETSGELSGGFKSALWGRLVLQACHEEPCILHCVVAVSALSKALKSKNSKSLCSTAESHLQYALRQYGKSLKGVREATARQENSLRTVLIAALLIFCFESFYGDMRLALTNIQSAVELMHDWLARNTDNSVSEAVSPASSVIEVEIVTALTRLGVHVMACIKSPHPMLNSLLRYALTDIFSIPVAFKTIQEACVYWHIVVNRIFQYLSSIPVTRRHCEGSKFRDILDENGNQLSKSLAEIRCWEASLKPVFDLSRTAAGDQDFICACLLRIQARSLEVSLRSAFFNLKDDRLYSFFLPEYYEIVSLCREVTQHPQFLKGSVFEGGIVPCLFMVLTKCQDRALRLEAISVLKMASPRREGVWDSLVVAKFGEDLMKFQEEHDEIRVSDGVEGRWKRLNAKAFESPNRQGLEEHDTLLNYFCHSLGVLNFAT